MLEEEGALICSEVTAWLGRDALSVGTSKLDPNCATQAPDVLVQVPRQVPKHRDLNEQGTPFNGYLCFSVAGTNNPPDLRLS